MGMERNPDACALNLKVQDFLKDDKKEEPDVLVCVQTMGTNRYFEHEKTVDVVNEMCKSLRVGGDDF